MSRAAAVMVRSGRRKRPAISQPSATATSTAARKTSAGPTLSWRPLKKFCEVPGGPFTLWDALRTSKPETASTRGRQRHEDPAVQQGELQP